jgi:hypothetical protein
MKSAQWALHCFLGKYCGPCLARSQQILHTRNKTCTAVDLGDAKELEHSEEKGGHFNFL